VAPQAGCRVFAVRTLSAGTELTCEDCGRPIARLKAALPGGTLVSAALFDGIDAILEPHKPMACPDCGGAFGRKTGVIGPNGKPQLKLHTKEGWV
jgi:hypothetical protein